MDFNAEFSIFAQFGYSNIFDIWHILNTTVEYKCVFMYDFYW